ncbi:hypothetical protein [Desulfomicrobium salsuginis]
MASSEKTSKPLGKTLVFGALTAAFYTGFFAYGDAIAAQFAQGSFWAAGPIATVFAVSYLHGEFASNLWATLGVSAIRKDTRKTAEATKRPAQRPVLNA